MSDAADDDFDLTGERPKPKKGKKGRKGDGEGRKKIARILVTEGQVADRMASECSGKLRFDAAANVWYEFTGPRWEREQYRRAFRIAHETSRSVCLEACAEAEGVDDAAVAKTDSANFAAGVERLAKVHPDFVTTSDEWDADPYLLATPTGVVDLHIGKLRFARPADNITKMTSVGPADMADCPTWIAFITDYCGGDQEKVEHLQRWFGYCLTGDTKEQKLQYHHGPGGNGKSTLLGTLLWIMGDYGATAALDSFTAHTFGSRHTSDLAGLRGARLVVTTEIQEGAKWDERRIKALTGGDAIRVQFMRQDYFEYKPTFKIVPAGNSKPGFENVGRAMRRRMLLFAATHIPKTDDKDLPEKLKEEGPGILRWAIEGCLMWQRDGLKTPQSVIDATDEYFAAEDHFGRWVRERCRTGDAAYQTHPGRLMEAFLSWCREGDVEEPTRPKIRQMVEALPGVRYVTIKGTQIVKGIALRAIQDEPTQEAEPPPSQPDLAVPPIYARRDAQAQPDPEAERERYDTHALRCLHEGGGTLSEPTFREKFVFGCPREAFKPTCQRLQLRHAMSWSRAGASITQEGLEWLKAHTRH